MGGLMDLLIPSAHAYDTGEHKWMVDEACRLLLGKEVRLKVGDIGFTLGEITSLAADYYKDPETLRSNAKRARTFLEQHADKLAAFQPVGEFTSAIATHGTYVSLASSNYSHFRFGSPSENAPDLCERYHRQALFHGASTDDALLHEGFALHFLTDLFSAGHMRTPRFALTQQLAKIPYLPDNAAILGGLLAKAMHDEDNERGLKCVFTEVTDFVAMRPGTLVEATYYGDGNLKRIKDTARGAGKEAVAAQRALLQLFRTIVWDVVTAVPSLAPLLESTEYGKELAPLLPVWRKAEASAAFTGQTVAGLYRKFIDAATPRALPAPANPDPLFYVKGGAVYAARPVSDAVVKYLHIRCNDGLLNKAWLELYEVHLNMTYITVNPYITMDADLRVRLPPYSVKPYVQLKVDVDAGLGTAKKTTNLLDHGLVIDGNSQLVVDLFHNVIYLAWGIRTSMDIARDMKDKIVDGATRAKDATVEALENAKDATVEALEDAKDLTVEGMKQAGEDLHKILKKAGNILVPPAY